MKANFKINPLKVLLITLIGVIPILAAKTTSDLRVIQHNDQKIQVKYPSNLRYSERKLANIWLQRVSNALLTVYGVWPKDNFNIKIRRSTRGKGPVPWGQVSRGNPNEVLLVINPDYGLKKMTKDWTAYHELSHLLIPYQGYGDLWFSEGLASYYQNILQARTGLLSETDFWQKLVNGFERGRKQNSWPTVNLTKVSDERRNYRSYMRIYWSGVHYWLTADLQLREMSDNKQSLDLALKALKDCCQNRTMSASAIASKLDQVTGFSVFKTLFNKYRNSYSMPDYLPLLKNLEIKIDTYGGLVKLNASNSDSSIRKGIYKGTLKY